MLTKFLLHGGASSEVQESNNLFFQEFTKDLADGANILFIGFARETETEQQEVFERDRVKILASTDKNINVEKAELDIFKEQLIKADAIYATGGVSKILKERLQTCPEFADLLAGKTYAGSSAGANVVSKYHTSGFTEGVLEGLDILPVCVMAHYGNPDFNGTDETEHWFNDVRGDMELIKLPECEWISREVEL